MLRVALIDDEHLARQAMRQLFAAHASVEIVGEADNVERGKKMILETKPDAIFLDIQMPGADGFELLAGLDPAPKTVFVTAHSEHAVRAFEVHAIDYLLKPVRLERIAESLQRLQAETEDKTVHYRPSDRICLHTPGWTTVAALSDLIVLKADGDFTRFFIQGHNPLLICQSLGTYEATLPNPPFLRLDRSLIVNAERIEKADLLSRDEANLHLRGLDQPVVLGRTAWSRLKKSGFLHP